MVANEHGNYHQYYDEPGNDHQHQIMFTRVVAISIIIIS